MIPSKDFTGHLTIAKTTYKWNIDIAEIKNGQQKEKFYSTLFYAGNSKWQLCLYPKGESISDDGYLSIYLFLRNSTKVVKISFEISIIDKTEQRYKTYKVNQHEFSIGRNWGFPQFAKLQDIHTASDQLLVKNKLQILVEIQPSTNAYSEFPLNFENLFDNQKFSDVKFVLGDDKYLLAHKNILSSQSTVFAAMLEHDMKENIDNEIKIPDVDNDVLVAMVHFMYSGKIDDIENLAQRLLIAADKYDLNSLKIMCAEYLGDNLSLENAVECLDLAYRYSANSLEVRAVDFIASNIQDMVNGPEFPALANLDGSATLKIIRQLALNK